MRSHSFWAFLAALALTAGARADDDTYTIKLKHGPEVGKSVTVTDTDTKTQSNKVSDSDGKVIDDGKKHTEKQDEVYTETVLARGDKDATKYKRTYEKATRTHDGKTEERSYQGRTVLFEKKGDKFTVTAEGDKPLSKEDLDDLTRKANDADTSRDEIFLPGKPVKVGDTWTVKGEDLVKTLGKGGNLDPKNSSAEGKLVKVYKKDNHQFGVIEMTLKLAPAATPGIKYEKTPVVEMKITLDTAIDGSTASGVMSMTGSMAAKGTAEAAGKTFTVDTSIEMSGKQDRSAEK
jgi:hypothetical protein